MATNMTFCGDNHNIDKPCHRCNAVVALVDTLQVTQDRARAIVNSLILHECTFSKPTDPRTTGRQRTYARHRTDRKHRRNKRGERPRVG